MYSSTRFGRPHAHHQDLENLSSCLWFYCWSVVEAVLLVVVGPAHRARPRTQHDCYQDTNVKPEAAAAVIELLMIDGKTPETC
jgi:endonuclease V-like protein UPF0215 family